MSFLFSNRLPGHEWRYGSSGIQAADFRAIPAAPNAAVRFLQFADASNVTDPDRAFASCVAESITADKTLGKNDYGNIIFARMRSDLIFRRVPVQEAGNPLPAKLPCMLMYDGEDHDGEDHDELISIHDVVAAWAIQIYSANLADAATIPVARPPQPDDQCVLYGTSFVILLRLEGFIGRDPVISIHRRTHVITADPYLKGTERHERRRQRRLARQQAREAAADEEEQEEEEDVEEEEEEVEEDEDEEEEEEEDDDEDEVDEE